MYEHILIPTDGSRLSNSAVLRGIQLASAIRARVTVLTVTPTFDAVATDRFAAVITRDQHRWRCQTEAEWYLAPAAAVARMVGVRCETLDVEHEHPYQAILDIARDRACDLIIMAPHGRMGAAAAVLGSETNKVLTHSSIPVMVCR